MSILLPAQEVQSIIKNFNVSISEYEIIDMQEYQGWSSKYLYLLVAENENYILKGKTKDQIQGYDHEVIICETLLSNGIETRKPIYTINGDIFFEKDSVYWSLMTYIAGASSHIDEYNEATIKTLAKHINQYVEITKDIKGLSINNNNDQVIQASLSEFQKKLPSFMDLNIMDSNFYFDPFIYKTDKNNITCIIHNDINPRNILIDHSNKQVISLIDWDHGCYGDPMKDVSDTIAIFYDYFDQKTADSFYNIFTQSLSFFPYDNKYINDCFIYFYTYSKWRSMLFFLGLIETLGDTTGEQNRFISEISITFNKWRKTINLLSK